MECSKCSKSLKLDEHLKCSSCLSCYHYTCTGMSEADFKKMLPMNKPKWKCSSCKMPKKPGSPVVIHKHSTDDTESGLPSASIVNIDTNALIKYFDTKFAVLNDTVNALKSHVDDRLSEFSALVNSWEGRICSLEAKVDRLADVQTENEHLRTELTKIQSHCDDMDQKSRMCNIELQNVPEKKNENLLNIAEALGKLLNMPIPQNSIRDVHRVAHNSQTDRPKNIIIQLTTRRLRDDVVAAARVRRGLTAGQLFAAAGLNGGASASAAEVTAAGAPIFVNEHLTLKNKILYARAREAKVNKNYKYIWVKNATILMRKSDDSRVIAIRCDNDLNKL